MPNIPVPCTNCLRFHYGICREAPKQCFHCGGFNHIERYCPRKRHVQFDHGGPLPGTRSWCEMFGLNDHPELKRKILNALKISPASAIWVDNRCIYQGTERHFTREEAPRGRPLDERISRRRSRSPLRGGRVRKRSRSPIGRFQRAPSPERRQHSPSPIRRGRFRSRSPIRQRSPSPYRPQPPQPRSSRYTSGSNATAFEPRQESENVRPLHNEPIVRFNLPIHPKPVPRHLSGPPLSSFKPAELKAQLRQVPGNIPREQQPTVALRALQKISIGTPLQMISVATPQAAPAQTNTAPASQADFEGPFVDDPYFVLGVGEGALEAEVSDAYEQRMWEVELERMSEGSLPTDGVKPNVFDESVRILNAAKKQLLGY